MEQHPVTNVCQIYPAIMLAVTESAGAIYYRSARPPAANHWTRTPQGYLFVDSTSHEALMGQSKTGASQ
jgi:hypothetical protein